MTAEERIEEFRKKWGTRTWRLVLKAMIDELPLEAVDLKKVSGELLEDLRQVLAC